ncbi:MAG: hypothetical protein EOM76_04150 [Sphingobacteriia bacterium]|nr:hypothetical protein [Sphingobacteriia bacterium]
MSQIQNTDIFRILQSQSTEELLVMLEEAQDEENYEEIHATIKQIVVERGDAFREPDRVKSIVQTLDEDMKDYKLAIRYELRLMPIWLIGLAIVQFIFVGNIFILLLPGVLLFLAILCLFYRRRITYLITGSGIAIVGVSNLLIVVFLRTTIGVRGNLDFAFNLILLIIYGCLLIFWGIRVMHKYWLLAPPPGANLPEQIEEEDFEPVSDNEQSTEISEIIEIAEINVENEKINEENLEKINVLILGLKSVFKSGKSAAELSSLFGKMINSKNDAIKLILQYRSKFGHDVITQINKHTSSYSLKKQLLQKFIEHGVVEEDYPHNYLLDFSKP